MSWMARAKRARLEFVNRRAGPWIQTLECGLRNVEAISTVALLDLLGVPPTTGNARRLAQTMRSIGFIPLKSRRLMPGGFRGTTIRGWARPLRERGCLTTTPNRTARAVSDDYLTSAPPAGRSIRSRMKGVNHE
jgi:hypothetical protein